MTETSSPSSLPINLVIMQPTGYVHSLGFLDQARYFRFQLRRLGCDVTIVRNRLYRDRLNLVFGAHLFDQQEWLDALQTHPCVLVNLEQLGEGGARLPAWHEPLLRQMPVIDYDRDNLQVLGLADEPGHLVSFGFAPYLRPKVLSLEDRPIDLLFFGSVNERREALFRRIEAAGYPVSVFDRPLYGEERDQFIRSSRFVLNGHFYEAQRLEQARLSLCLSLGTPVISEHGSGVEPGALADCVWWFEEGNLEAVLHQALRTPEGMETSLAQLERFTRYDPAPRFERLHERLAMLWASTQQKRLAVTEAPPVRRINLGSGRDYKPGWLNLDIVDRTEPDALLDLGQPLEWPIRVRGRFGADIVLEKGSVEVVHASNVLEHVPDLPRLMTNILELLEPGGRMEVEVPNEDGRTAWQDPTHVRAMNRQSWLYYTDWFWYLGWFSHRFHASDIEWLDDRLQPCAEAGAAFMRLVLIKIETTPWERTQARMWQADFGGLPQD